MEKTQQDHESTPFILGFLEEYKGAVAVTTSGTHDNIDAADAA